MTSAPKDFATGKGPETAKQAIIYAKWDSDPITSFEVDTQEDIPGNLEAFVRLSRLGRFSEASAFFEKTLRPHVDQFPVFIEYADLLLEQGNFDSLSKFMQSASKYLFSAEEDVLVGLLQALANIFVSGAWESGRVLARQAWEFLETQSLDNDELPSDVQIHIIETYLAITVLMIQRSDLKVEPAEPRRFPWMVTGNTLIAKCGPFLKWHDTLQAHGLLWEGHMILQLLLPFLNIDKVLEIAHPRTLSNTVLSVDSVKSDESQLLTVLTIVNDIIRYALAFFSRQSMTNKTGLSDFIVPYYHLATTVIGLVFGDDPTASQGRLVIQWMLVKEQILVLGYPPALESNVVQPRLSKLCVAARVHGDIRLQAELLSAAFWVDGNSKRNKSAGHHWDVTFLAAPLFPPVILPQGVSRNKLKSILEKHLSDWATVTATTTTGELWDSILIHALKDERNALLECLLRIMFDSLIFMSEDSSAWSLATKLLGELERQKINASLVKSFIHLGLAEVARALIEISEVDSIETEEWEQLLPLAIRKRQPSVVDILVSKFPKSSVRIDESGCYPLWYNKFTGPGEDPEDLEIALKIRDLIAPMTIAQLPLVDAKTALGEDAKELFLDLEFLRSSDENISAFMNTISSPVEEASSAVMFESVLSYVHIPNLDNMEYLKKSFQQIVRLGENSRMNNPIGRIFEWLSREKGVKKILRITVEDSVACPHNEDEIVEAIEKFDVEILHWETSDLSIDCVLNAAPHVKELYLYSSKWVSICQWTSSEGAVILPKLEVLHITILNSPLTEALADRYLRKAKERMALLLKSSSRTIRLEIRLTAAKVKSQTPTEAMQLEPFLQGYLSLQNRSSVLSLQPRLRTKIAILGAGLNRTLAAWTKVNQIYAGNLTEKSFFSYLGAKGNYWTVSSSSHMTYFTSVVCQLDPFCDLFVAKLVETAGRIDNNQFESAINWAVYFKADIVFMDVRLPEPETKIASSKLKSCIGHAESRGTIFIAGAEEGLWLNDCLSEGLIVTNWATYKKSKAHVFCNSSGIALPGLDSEIANAMSPESAAVALAIGIASLTLAVLYLTQYSSAPANFNRGQFRNKVLDILVKEMDGSNCLKPWLWFGLEPVYTMKDLRSRLKKTSHDKGTPFEKEYGSRMPLVPLRKK